MRELLRNARLGLAAIALAGPWALAAAAPADDVIVKRTVRIDAPFVAAIDLDAVPGFKKKMRGDSIAYCRIEQKIGTRFKTETCIDQTQMATYLAALEENQRQVKDLGNGETRIN